MTRFLVGLAVLFALVATIKAGVCESDCKCKTQYTADKPNWKQCTWKNINHDADHGYVKNCTINKRAKTSALKVTFNGVLRISDCYSCCKRWYVTFNGKECKGPAPIDTIIYQATDLNIHRGVSIVGYCNKLAKGKNEVALHIGECQKWRGVYSQTGNTFTGWNSNTRLIIEEVEMPDDDVENVLSTTN